MDNAKHCFFLVSIEELSISLTNAFVLPIVPRGSSDTVIAAKHDALPPTISAKSTDKKGNCSIFSGNGTTYQKLCCRFC